MEPIIEKREVSFFAPLLILVIVGLILAYFALQRPALIGVWEGVLEEQSAIALVASRNRNPLSITLYEFNRDGTMRIGHREVGFRVFHLHWQVIGPFLIIFPPSNPSAYSIYHYRISGDTLFLRYIDIRSERWYMSPSFNNLRTRVQKRLNKVAI